MGNYQYYDIYFDYTEMIDEVTEDGWYCTGTIYEDCDPSYAVTEMSCLNDFAWSYYTYKSSPDVEEDYYSYYMEYDDTYYHLYCSDAAQLDCEE